jgi:hypothetical protein
MHGFGLESALPFLQHYYTKSGVMPQNHDRRHTTAFTVKSDRCLEREHMKKSNIMRILLNVRLADLLISLSLAWALNAAAGPRPNAWITYIPSVVICAILLWRVMRKKESSTSTSNEPQ